MKQNISRILLLALACAMVSACGPAKLRNMVDEFNKQCPVSLGMIGTMDSASYDANTVAIYYTMPAEYIDLDMIRQNEELFHDNMLATYANSNNESFKKLIDVIVEAGANMDVVLNTTEGDGYTFHFTADEIKGNRPGEDGDPNVFLQNFIENTRMQLPTDIGSGLTLSDVSLDDNYFTYYYECDEDLIDIDLLQQEFTDNREEVISNIDVTDPMTAKLFRTIKESNRGYAMTYIGKTSGKTATITIESQEL